MVDYPSATGIKYIDIGARRLTGSGCSGYSDMTETKSPRVTPVLGSLADPVNYSFSNGERHGDFKSARESGAIKMTPLHIGSDESKSFIVSYARRAATFTRWYGACYPGPTCNYDTGLLAATTDWTEQWDLSRWSNQSGLDKPAEYHKRDDVETAIQAAIISTQNAAVAAFKSGYDLLTELGEGKQTLTFFGETFNRFAKFQQQFRQKIGGTTAEFKAASEISPKTLLKSSNRYFKSFGNLWMTYRYAIMPLVYSVRDIHEVYKAIGTLYKTTRSYENIELNSFDPNNIGGRATVFTSKGTVSVRTTVKGGFNKEGIHTRLMQDIGFNPLVTAWELIPLSFVVDWFVGVGDFLAAHTSLDLTAQRKMCTSVKRDYVEQVWLRNNLPDTLTKSWPNSICGNQQMDITLKRDVCGLLFERKVKTYKRELFESPAVDIALNNSFMNWKRWADTSVLSYNSARKGVKGL